MLEHHDADGNVLYQWIFRGEDMDGISSDINLRINFITEGLEWIYGVDPAKPAVALQFEHDGVFPSGTSIKFNGAGFGFAAGSAAYPYSFDSAAGNLTLLQADLETDSDGMIQLHLTSSSDILVAGAQLKPSDHVGNTIYWKY